ncbi:dihydrolipoamide acetyltransferase [Helicobacter pylori]|nr:dihydrolipoamide acetyltransferase [Helicobacter pylori]
MLDLDGGHWDLWVPSSSKESVTFRFDNLPKDHNGKEENFYACSSLKDLKRDGFVAIDFGTKSTTAIYMNKNGRYCIGRCINNMHNGVFLKYFLSYPIKYERPQAEKIRESFEKGLRKSLPRHVFDDEKTAKNFKVELRASEPCAYAISALKSYGFDKTAKLDKPIYYGVFDFGDGTTDFNFGKWEKSANPKFAYKMTHFSSGGDKYLGGENLLEWLAFEAYAQNFQTLKEKDIVIAKPNYDRINEQRFGSFMKNPVECA